MSPVVGLCAWGGATPYTWWQTVGELLIVLGTIGGALGFMSLALGPLVYR